MRMLITGFAMLMAFNVAARADVAAGKAVFEKTCKNCHGPDGKGERIADKFYKMTVPRLGGKYVQAKSDAELKEIVTQGRRKMKPVTTGAPAVEHKLAAESVDDVIAYVRTLSQ